MSSIDYKHNDGDDYVTELIDTGTQVAEVTGHIPYYKLRVETNDGEITGDGQDTETVTISVMSGLDYVSNDRETVIGYSGEVAGTVDGIERTTQIRDGTVSFDVTTDKAAGSEIEIVAKSLADHPAQTDSATIEVVSQ